VEAEARAKLQRYLRAVRAACVDALASVQDLDKRRTLEQACVVLGRLIVEAGVLAELEARAAGNYVELFATTLSPAHENRGVMPHSGPQDPEEARCLVQKLLSSGGEVPDAFLARVIAIEREYLLGFENAFKSETAATADGERAAHSREPTQDIAALSDYMSRVFDTPVRVRSLETMALGYSKSTLLAALHSGEARVPATVVLRIDRKFNYLATTVLDEYPILKVLHARGIPVPCPYALEPSGGVLGEPFLVLERIRGQNIGSHFRFPAQNRPLARKLAAVLARIHSVPIEEFGAKLKHAADNPRQELQAEVDRAYEEWTKLRLVSPVIEAAFGWLRRNVSLAEGPRGLVHGDFSLSNVLIDEHEEVVGILDWEFAHSGNPLADVGWFYMAATHLAGWEYFLEAYRQAGGWRGSGRQLAFFVLWGALRLAVISHQVESGFEEGRSADIKDAFAGASFVREATLRVTSRLADLLRVSRDTPPGVLPARQHRPRRR
jgi:aminoglycoside phosphotransferase (APT) family kinase protein